MPKKRSYLSDKFHPTVRQWFTDNYAAPTAIQNEAWEKISEGENTLVVAPTGSGKTLAAFLWAIQDLLRSKTEDSALQASGDKKQPKGVKVLYVSPLKALGADVEKNLQVPLQAIENLWCQDCSNEVNISDGQLIRVAMRSGDTTAEERRKIVSKPPDILITTPESLYLMLTSQASSVLTTVQTVIIDEIHSLVPNKRGAHLSLSLERLDALLEKPAQRIGLSATVNPVPVVASYLGGIHPVTVVQDTHRQAFDLSISVPVSDMTAVPRNNGAVGTDSRSLKTIASSRATKDVWKTDRGLKAAMAANDKNHPLGKVNPDERRGSSSLWPYIESSLLDEILAHSSTIVFVNSRGLCERLTARLNELHAKRLGLSSLLPQGSSCDVKNAQNELFSPMRSDIGSTTQLVSTLEDHQVIAKAHHGSVSKEKRLRVESELKSGQLRCVVATSSLELGIDMGSVDLVLQIAPPLSVASGLQRIGRANHQVGGKSKAIMYPRTRLELLDSVVMAKAMHEGNLEPINYVQNALDVLAQQTVAAVSQKSWSAGEWYEVVRKSACYSDLSEKAFREVLAMVSGYYSRGDLSDFAPRVDWNRETDKLSARANSQRLAVSGGGTIPDRGLFPVVLPEGVGKGGRKRVGELDEEMVYESRVGDVIALGTSSWRIKEISADRVMVEPAPGHIARLPFWHGEQPGRSFEFGWEKGAFVRELVTTLADGGPGDQDRGCFNEQTTQRLLELGLDERGQKNLASLLRSQQAATTWVPDDRKLVVEHCQDDMGQWRIFLHSPFGKFVHEPWALAVSWRVQTQWGYDPCAIATDDGIMLQIPLTETTFPDKSIFEFDPEEIAQIVRTQVDSTALFAARFRECAMRSLLMSPTPHGKRAPLWQQRIKAGQLLEGARREQGFPLLAEAARECLADVYNLQGLQQLQTQIAAGSITLHDVTTTIPSPFAASLVFAYVGEHLYDPDKPKSAQQAALLSLDTSLLVELLGGANLADLIDEEVLNKLVCELQHLDPCITSRGPEALERLLRELGPLTTQEMVARLSNSHLAEVELWLKELMDDEKVFEVALGSCRLWAQVHDMPWIQCLTSACLPDWAMKQCDVDALNTTVWAQKFLEDELIRYGKTHGPFSAQDFAQRFGLGLGFVDEALICLEAQGVFLRGVMRKGSSEVQWIHRDILARLRKRTLSAARSAVKPVKFTEYVRQVFLLQGAAPQNLLPEGSVALLDVVARFEGCYLPAALWEEVIFPARVKSYKSASLDMLLEAGDVIWWQQGDTVAFYPNDSPFGPIPCDGFCGTDNSMEQITADESLLTSNAIKEALALKGPLLYGDLLEQLALEGDYSDQEVVRSLQALCEQGAVGNDSFAFIRAQGSEDLTSLVSAATSKSLSTPPVSRRGRLSLSGSRALKKEARNTVLARNRQNLALGGHWFLLEPSESTPEEIALAVIETVLDLYGIVSPDTLKLSGAMVEWSALSKALRTMEEAGVILRGCFVEELGPVQYAQKETIDALQGTSLEKSASKGLSEASWLALAANDPAQCFGVLAHWPDPVDVLVQDRGQSVAGGVAPGQMVQLEQELGQAKRPRLQRSKEWLTVFCDGELVLVVMTTFKSAYVFTDDGRMVKHALELALETIKSQAQRRGESLSRKKIVAKTINGKDIFGTAYAELLTECGFVPLPDGLRYYPQPF